MTEFAETKLAELGAVLKKGSKGSVLLADLTSFDHEKIDEGVFELLAEFSKLKELNIARLPVNDAMLQKLHKTTSLQSIDLTGTEISDQSVQWLSSLPNLKLVQLSETRVTSDTIATVRKKMIDTRIVYR